MRFRSAPEVLRGEVLPDTHTDRFSLAVILFMALTYGHPFQGEYLRNYPFIDEVAEMELYGTKPLFIFDPKNTSNRPIRGYHNVVLNYWPQTPSYLQQEFIKTFTEGLLDRENGRTTEIRWVRLFQRYRDELVVCPHCQFEYPNQTFPQSTCPKCKKQHPLLGKLTIHNNVIYLAKNKALYATHLDKTSSEYNRAVGKVIQNQKDQTLFALKNLSSSEWKITDALGKSKVIPSDGIFRLDIRYLLIEFGDGIQGEFQAI